MSLSDADTITGLIYDAPLSGDWTSPLRAMQRRFGCGHVVLIQHDLALGNQVVTGSGDQSLEVRYLEHFVSLNHAWLRLMRHTPGEPVTDAMLLDLSAFRSSRFFNEFLLPNGLVSLAGGLLSRSSDRACGISLSRPDGLEPFGEADLRDLRPLMAHLARAERLQHRLGEAEHATTADAWALLDRLRIGVVVVDAQARLVHANRAADAILQSADGLTLRQGRIVAAAEAAGAALLAAIARRLRPASGASDPDAPLRMDRPSGRRPFLIDILPLQGPPGWVGTRRSCCALFITDLDGLPRPADGSLRRLFGLTPAEATVAALVGGGESQAAVAASLGVSANTVHTHLKRVFDKTDLHRHAELVRLVERLAGTLRDGGGTAPEG